MSDPFEARRRRLSREKMLFQYSRALQQADLDAVDIVLAEAANDPELMGMILEMNGALEAEDARAVAQEGPDLVLQSLLQEHFPSNTEDIGETDLPPLTVADVLSRLKEDAPRFISVEREAAEADRGAAAPVPQDLSQRSVRQFFDRLGLSMSERFREAFRETAILLSMGRRQSELRMAMTRRQERQRGTDREKQE